MSNESDVQRRLASLQSELAASIDQLNTRRQRLLVVLVVLLVISVGYLSFIYTKLSKVDAPTVVELVVQQIEPSLNTAGDQFGDALKAQAPHIMSDLEKSFKALPDQLAAQGRMTLNQKMREDLPKAELQLYQTLSDLIIAAKLKAKEAGVNADDPAAIEKLVDTIAPMLQDEAKKALDEFYKKYATSSESLMAYLGELSTNTNLTQRQKHHREIVAVTLALLNKHMTSSQTTVAAPATN